MSALLRYEAPKLVLPRKPKLGLASPFDLRAACEWHLANGKRVPDWFFDEIDTVANLTPPNIGGAFEWFEANPTTIPGGSTKIEAFRIPQWCRFISVYLTGSGAAGGNGFSGASASPRGGGGGGGSGAYSRAIIPVGMLGGAALLYYSLAAGGFGVAGLSSFLTFVPSANLIDALLVSTGGGLGGNGTAAAGGTAGTAAGGYGLTNLHIVIGHIQSNGAGGGAGGAHTGANGGDISFLSIIVGGAGGGGTTSADFRGGNLNGNGRFRAVAGGINISPDGRDGVYQDRMPISGGGSGGAGINLSAGGNGGNGAKGGGGGGGGGGGTTGGIGGRGGDGRLVLVLY